MRGRRRQGIELLEGKGNESTGLERFGSREVQPKGGVREVKQEDA